MPLIAAAACAMPAPPVNADAGSCERSGSSVSSGYKCTCQCLAGLTPQAGTTGDLACVDGKITEPNLACERMSAAKRFLIQPAGKYIE